MPLLLILLLMASPLLAADKKPVPVELQNPGFEDELKGWDNAAAPAMAGAFTVDTDIKRLGKAALHVKPQTPEQWPWLSQKVGKIEPGATYLLSVWHQGGMTPASDACAALKLEFLDAEGKSVGARVARQQVRMQQWLFLALAAPAPPSAAAAVAYVRVMGQAEVWFDDVELLRQRPPPQLMLTPPRLALKAGETPTVRLQVTAAEDLPEKAQAEVVLLAPNGKPVKGVTGELARPDKRTFAGELTVPKLSPGRYVWQVKVGPESALAHLFVAPERRRPKSLTEQGIMLVDDGQPFFPIGLYHVAVGDYKAVAEQGFNMVQGLGTHEARLLRGAVQEAGSQKLRMQLPLHTGGLVGANLKSSQEKLAYFRTNPVVLDGKIADEPDENPETADEVPEVYSALKQKEDQCPLLLTVADPASYAYWAHWCDSLQVVAFPLPDSPLTLVADRVRQAKAVLEPWQHLSVLLPAGYRAGAAVQPTFEQARLMAYLAVIGGARGVWWYALRSPGYNLSEGELWKQFRRLNEETAALGAAAIGGAEVALQSDNPKLHAGAWQSGEKVRIAVANPAEEAQTATLKLEGAFEKVEVAKGSGQAEIKEGAVQVTLPPGEAGLLTAALAK